MPTLVKLPPKRLERRLLRTHDEAVLRAMLIFKPKDFAQWRVYAVVSKIAVTGKGRKERRVPFGIEMRKSAVPVWAVQRALDVRSQLMFPAREGGGGSSECAPELLLSASNPTQWSSVGEGRLTKEARNEQGAEKR